MNGSGRLIPAKIQKDFRIAAKSLEKYRWVLAAIYDLIERSRVPTPTAVI